jgi:hypothetical protein
MHMIANREGVEIPEKTGPVQGHFVQGKRVQGRGCTFVGSGESCGQVAHGDGLKETAEEPDEPEEGDDEIDIDDFDDEDEGVI